MSSWQKPLRALVWWVVVSFALLCFVFRYLLQHCWHRLQVLVCEDLLDVGLSQALVWLIGPVAQWIRATAF